MSSLQRCVSGAALDISYSVGGGGVICEESRGGGGEGGASSPLPITGAEVRTPRHSPSAGPDPDLPAAGFAPVQSLRALPPTPPLTMEGGEWEVMPISSHTPMGVSSRSPQLGTSPLRWFNVKNTKKPIFLRPGQLCPGEPPQAVTFLAAQGCARGAAI